MLGRMTWGSSQLVLLFCILGAVYGEVCVTDLFAECNWYFGMSDRCSLSMKGGSCDKLLLNITQATRGKISIRQSITKPMEILSKSYFEWISDELIAIKNLTINGNVFFTQEKPINTHVTSSSIIVSSTFTVLQNSKVNLGISTDLSGDVIIMGNLLLSIIEVKPQNLWDPVFVTKHELGKLQVKDGGLLGIQGNFSATNPFSILTIKSVTLRDTGGLEVALPLSSPSPFPIYANLLVYGDSRLQTSVPLLVKNVNVTEGSRLTVTVTHTDPNCTLKVDEKIDLYGTIVSTMTLLSDQALNLYSGSLEIERTKAKSVAILGTVQVNLKNFTADTVTFTNGKLVSSYGILKVNSATINGVSSIGSSQGESAIVVNSNLEVSAGSTLQLFGNLTVEGTIKVFGNLELSGVHSHLTSTRKYVSLNGYTQSQTGSLTGKGTLNSSVHLNGYVKVGTSDSQLQVNNMLTVSEYATVQIIGKLTAKEKIEVFGSLILSPLPNVSNAYITSPSVNVMGRNAVLGGSGSIEGDVIFTKGGMLSAGGVLGTTATFVGEMNVYGHVNLSSDTSLVIFSPNETII